MATMLWQSESSEQRQHGQLVARMRYVQRAFVVRYSNPLLPAAGG